MEGYIEPEDPSMTLVPNTQTEELYALHSKFSKLFQMSNQ